MRKVKEFEVFGILYECKQLPAVEAMEMVDCITILTPKELLKGVNVIKYDGTRVALNTPAMIDKEIKDCMNRLPPKVVLNAVMEIVKGHNFAFLNEWRGVTIPKRFLSNAETVSSTYVEPVFAAIMNNGLATYKELEEYYSLQDAFIMFDAILTKTVNESYAHEAAEAEARDRRR